VTLQEGLAALGAGGLTVPAGAIAQLEAYLALLQKWNRTYNLTAVRDAERMVTHHLLDSLAIVPYLDDGFARHDERAPAGGSAVNGHPLAVLDVGSGAGLPGIPLAVARPAWTVTMVDSNRKKAAFIQQAIGELGLARASARAARIEDVQPPPRHGAIVSRAYSDLASFAEAALRLLAPGGRLYAMKGLVPHEEIAELPASARLVAVHALAVPGVDAQRHLVVMERA
jgi:16S rRNA (guanine527-N7)-methyltransferase